jgi:hypothetical protein
MKQRILRDLITQKAYKGLAGNSVFSWQDDI